MCCMREVGWQQLMIDTSQTLALTGCTDSRAVDSCKSNKGHWVEPQTVDFYTADLYLIVLSDHNYGFSKYKTHSYRLQL